MAAGPLAVLPAIWVVSAVAAWRRSLRPRAGLCATCGYDLRASQGRCFECGTPIDPATVLPHPAAPTG